MTTISTRPSPSDPLARARFQAALFSAIVAGLFVLAVGGLLAAAHIRTRTLDLHKSEELAGLRAALVKTPDDAAAARLREAIRARDLQLREDYFGRETFSKTGGYLLLAGAVVFVIAASRAAACRKRLPMPRTDPEAMRKAAATARRARWAVAGLGLSIAAGAILLGLLSGGDLTGEPSPVAAANPSEGPPAVAAQPAAAGKPGPGPTQAAEGTPGAAPAPAAAVAPAPSDAEIQKQWPRFRGPGGLGVSAHANVPSSWNGKTGEGILWKTAVPLPGENSPVVWGDRIFLTGADENRRAVYCFDAATGKILWQRAVETPEGKAQAEPPEILEDTGYAAPTAATDGRRVAAVFANGDIACFDCAGKPLWARNLGQFKNSYGYSSSLHMYRDTVLVLLDEGTPGKTNSRLLALDAASGKTAWETPRPVPASWATPILISTGKRDEFITCAKPWVIAYDPATGKELWRVKALDGDVAPSPTYGGGLVLAAQSGAKGVAIRPDGAGDVTATHVAWIAEDGLPDIVSLLADGKLLWLTATEGTLTCHRLKDGSKAYEQEFDDMTVKSSPTLVGDRIYLVDEKGVTHILAAGEEFKELGKAALGEAVTASPAFLDGRIYMRGKTHLYAIGKK